MKSVNGANNKVMSLSKTKPTKICRLQCIKNVYGGEKEPRKLKIQEQSHDQIIKNIRNPFRLKKKKRKNQRQNDEGY